MSGKAILVLVVGTIIIAATVMFNIEASSTRIVRNFNEYYVRQTTMNIAQSGVNLALTELEKNHAWRTGVSGLKTMDGRVNVRVYDTIFDSVNAIAIESVGETNFGPSLARRDTSIVYLNRDGWHPAPLRGLITLNAPSAINGNIVIDGRNHDMTGSLIFGEGIPAIWTTGGSFTMSGAATAGGTVGMSDYSPASPAAAGVIATNQYYPAGYPKTPEEVLNVWSQNFPDGTLKAIAQSGYMGSQYVTDPKNLSLPLRGVTYVEMPTNTPKNVWSSADLDGDGLVVVHNSASNAVMKNAKGTFKGLVMADDIIHLHGDLLGGVIAFNGTLSGNVVGNGAANILFSEEAIVRATNTVRDAMRLNVIAWWE